MYYWVHTELTGTAWISLSCFEARLTKSPPLRKQSPLRVEQKSSGWSPGISESVNHSLREPLVGQAHSWNHSDGISSLPLQQHIPAHRQLPRLGAQHPVHLNQPEQCWPLWSYWNHRPPGLVCLLCVTHVSNTSNNCFAVWAPVAHLLD